MLEIIRFILKCIADTINMLFTIDLGFTTLGGLLCIIAFFLPLVATIINLLKFKMRGDD